jgi:hypothetical protein
MKILTEYLEALKNVFGTDLVSVILYGSRVSDFDYETKNSDFNLMVVLSKPDLEAIGRLAKDTASWAKAGNHPPLFFSEHELIRSTDVFPVEFNDILVSRKVLYGKDVFAGITIENKNLRHQCEFELKSKVLNLRRSFALYSDDEKRLAEALKSSVSSVLVLFRHSARLVCETPLDNAGALKVWEEKVGLQKGIFETIIGIKKDSAKGKHVVKDLFIGYVSEIQKVEEYVDSLSEC